MPPFKFNLIQLERSTFGDTFDSSRWKESGKSEQNRAEICIVRVPLSTAAWHKIKILPGDLQEGTDLLEKKFPAVWIHKVCLKK